MAPEESQERDTIHHDVAVNPNQARTITLRMELLGPTARAIRALPALQPPEI
jgi:hypothetical protein